MTILTAKGSFAKAYGTQFTAEVTSIRERGEAKFNKKLTQAQVIIHNASTITSTDLTTCLDRNFDFTRFVVKQVEGNSHAPHLVHISSMSILDPTNDSVYGDVIAMTPYAYSKYLAETFCLKSSVERLSCVRFSTLFYKDPTKDGLSKLIYDAVRTKKITIFNGGEARRNFLPLDTAAAYVHKITEIQKPQKDIYTLAAPVSTSFYDVVQLLKKHVPDLVIEDKQISNGAPVLAEFSTASIDRLGRIDFSLEDEIIAYMTELQI